MSVSIPVASACISVLFLLGTLPAQTNDEGVSTSEVSKVRIVRLSEVRGAVQLDRNTGRGYEAALANLPIVEHSRLQTGMGIAEIEFEDNSTLRVGPGSIVEFPQLDRLPGGTTSSVRLVKGTAYVSLLKTRGNEFNLLFGQQKLQLPPSSHIRLQMDGAQATLAVLDGTVRIDGPAGPAEVSKKNTATFHLLDQAEPTLARNVVPEALDSWDKTAAANHAQTGSTAFGSPYAYGMGDMMYYGSFMNVAGCGSMWRPYFASAAWDPYSNGAWAWYQGAGYSWVSPYPWGWTPYHFGSWSYCSGAGWGWQPGGSWNGLNNAIAVVSNGGGGVGSNGGPGRIPPRPIQPPGPGEPTLKAFNLRPVVRSEVSADSFVFRKDSAGLGIPREGLGKLDKLSQNAVSRGTATTPIYFSAPSSNGGNGRPTNGGGVAVPSVHRGSPPDTAAQRPSQPGPWNNGGVSSARSGPEPGYQPARSSAQPSSQAQPSNQGQSSSQAQPAATPAQGRPH